MHSNPVVLPVTGQTRQEVEFTLLGTNGLGDHDSARLHD